MTTFDPINDLLRLSKAGATGGKYYKRVPKGGGKKGYDYFYTKAAYEKTHGSDHVGGDAAAKMNAGSKRIKELMHPIPSSELGQHSPQRTQIQDTVDRAEEQFQSGNHSRAAETMKLAVFHAERVHGHIRDKREYAAEAAKRQAATNKKYGAPTESKARAGHDAALRAAVAAIPSRHRKDESSGGAAPKPKKPKGSKHHEVEVSSTRRYKGVAEVDISDDSKPGGQEFHTYQGRGATAKLQREHAMAQHAEKHGITKPLKSVNKALRERKRALAENAKTARTDTKGAKSGETRTVKIAGNQGPMEIEAKVYGDFAAHDGSITHLPTGMVVSHGDGTKKHAERLARHMRNEIGATHDEHKFVFGDRDSLPSSARKELGTALGSFKKSGVVMDMDPIEAMGVLSKGNATGGKYYKRVPKSGGKKGYDYFYSKAAYEKKHADKTKLPKSLMGTGKTKPKLKGGEAEVGRNWDATGNHPADKHDTGSDFSGDDQMSWASPGVRKKDKETKNYQTAMNEFSGYKVESMHLHADNDQQLYNQANSIRKNLINKMANGKYDPHQARNLWQYHADATAKSKGGPGGSLHDRRQMAHGNAVEFAQEARTGEHDHLLQKKHQGKKEKQAKERIGRAGKAHWSFHNTQHQAATAMPGSEFGPGAFKGVMSEAGYLAQANAMHAKMHAGDAIAGAVESTAQKVLDQGAKAYSAKHNPMDGQAGNPAPLHGKAMMPPSTKGQKDSNWDANKDAAEAGYHEVALAGKKQKTPKGAEGGFYPTQLAMKSERDQNQARHFNVRKPEFVQFADEPSANPLVALRKAQETEQHRMGALYGRDDDLVKSGHTATCPYHSAMGRAGGEHVVVPVCTCRH